MTRLITYGFLLAMLPGLAVSSAYGQTFGPQQVLATNANSAQSVYAADLDGDGDMDVLAAAHNNNKVVWFENLGGGSFGPERIITLEATGVRQIHVIDLDADGDPDVLSASDWDDKIAWYENLGGGNFGPQIVITTDAEGANDVFATDLDGDGDPDVLTASKTDDKVAWHENLGDGNFGPRQVITSNLNSPYSIHAVDLDGDGDADVLSASFNDNKIAWYENLGGGSFGPQQLLPSNVDKPRCVYAADLDGDGFADVLTASLFDDKIAWYKNLGGGDFSTERIITTDAEFAEFVYAIDMNGDGAIDVLSASAYDDKVAWYENQCDGNFGPQKVISTEANYPFCVHAADLDGDGDADVLSVSTIDSKVAWYENIAGFHVEVSTVQSACQGISDGSVQINGSGPRQGPYSYFWDWNDGGGNGNGTAATDVFTIDGLAAGEYDIMVVDAQGDSAFLCAVIVDERDCQPCQASFTTEDACLGQTVLLDASASQPGSAANLTDYSWDFGDGGNGSLASEIHLYSDPGTYNVLLVIEDDSGCIDSAVQTVTVFPAPTTEASPVPVCAGDSYVLPGGQSVSEPGVYVDTLVSSQGCDSVVVTELVIDEIGCETSCKLIAPSAFTPDGDGSNDVFFILSTCERAFADFELTIYNRWGEAVYAGRDIRQGWDGTFSGKPAAMDAYSYLVKYTQDGTETGELLKGLVWLLR